MLRTIELQGSYFRRDENGMVDEWEWFIEEVLGKQTPDQLAKIDSITITIDTDDTIISP